MPRGKACTTLDWPTTFTPGVTMRKAPGARWGHGGSAVLERMTKRLSATMPGKRARVQALKHKFLRINNSLENRDADGAIAQGDGIGT